MPESFGNLTQRVVPIYDGYYFARFEELLQESQILVWFVYQDDHLLAPGH